MGGAGAGAISHSEYMEIIHKDMLNAAGNYTVNFSVVQAMNTAFSTGYNPFIGVLTYNPDDDLARSATAVEALRVLVDAHSYITNVQSAVTSFTTDIVADTAVLDVATLDTDNLDVFVIDETLVKADVLAYSNSLEADLTDLTIPKFKASMFNIGATLGSAFVLGEAILRKEKLRQVAVFEADLRQKLQIQSTEINAKFRMQHKDKEAEFKLQFKELNAKFKIQYADTISNFKNQRWVTIRGLVTLALQDLMKKSELKVDVTRHTLESNRLKIIAKAEQAKENLLILEHSRRWDLDTFAYGTSVLGGIGAGALLPGKKSVAVSALAGALSGAAAGTAVSPGYGTVIGAVLGAAAGALSA